VSTGTPSIRLAAARRWGAAAADARRTREAAEGYAAAVGLLPAVAWHGLDLATREEQLAQWAGLAADAAACAVLDARPELAVELLEQGRSVLWAQALNLRSDLTRLTEIAPGLAGRLDSIRVILDSPVPEVTPALSERAAGSGPVAGRARQQQDAVELRVRKAREWDDVLAQVRALAGFEHFPTAIPYTQLAAVAANGPVVIVNASRYGCHALIVDALREQVRVVTLPDLSLDAAVDHANGMLRALAGAAEPRRAFLDREKDRRAVIGVLDRTGPSVRRTGPSGRQLAMWKSSSWMLSGSRKTSTEDGIGLSVSMTPECSMPSSSSQLAHASKLARSATPKEMWSRPVSLSWKGSPGLASRWCRPIAMPERGSMSSTA
jgi:hypothetical protein